MFLNEMALLEHYVKIYEHYSNRIPAFYTSVLMLKDLKGSFKIELIKNCE